jgi:hypothetical protein
MLNEMPPSLWRAADDVIERGRTIVLPFEADVRSGIVSGLARLV